MNDKGSNPREEFKSKATCPGPQSALAMFMINKARSRRGKYSYFVGSSRREGCKVLDTSLPRYWLLLNFERLDLSKKSKLHIS